VRSGPVHGRRETLKEAKLLPRDIKWEKKYRVKDEKSIKVRDEFN